jgi:hypothetical protein
VRDPYWKQAIRLYHELDATQRNTLFRIIRQVMADTIAGLLALLDGDTRLAGQGQDKFTLLLSDRRLNNGVADMFLEMEQEAGEYDH